MKQMRNISGSQQNPSKNSPNPSKSINFFLAILTQNLHKLNLKLILHTFLPLFHWTIKK